MIRFLLLFLLINCKGYKIDDNTKLKLSQIEIGKTSSIEEAETYERLSNLLQPKEPTKYLLNFKLDYSESNIAITRTSDVMRKSLVQTIHFELIEKETDQVLLKKSIALHSSYSTIQEPMVSNGQMTSNKKLLAIRAAEILRYHLMIKFFQLASNGEKSPAVF
jgi:hypothetical protein